MKKAGIVLLIVLGVLFVKLTFFSTDDRSETIIDSANCSHNWQPATFDSPSQCSLCHTTVGEKLPPMSEWGFNYLSEMENGLVEVVSYGDSYVHATGNILRFENGYMLNQSFSVRHAMCAFSTTSNPQKYAVVNNDNLDINNGYKSLRIAERKTIPGKDNFVCFVKPAGTFELEQWFVPYSLIDWDRPALIVPSEERETAIKLYLVS